jgi:ribosomal protein S18 acetylase RimI-like enzyme
MNAVQRQRYTIRLAVVADARELAAFERNAFISYYAPHRFSEEQFAKYLARPRTIAYVGEDRGRIIGYALGVLVHSTPPVARLVSLAVAAEYRCRGIGRVLLSRFLAAVRRRGAHAAYLETADRNAAARALFARHGFVPVRRLRGYYADSVDGIRMRRAW